MDWIEITAADAKAGLTSYEWEAITEATRASGASSLLTTLISRVVNRVRMFVISCDRNTLGPEGYVPGELYDAAQILLLEAISNSLPAANLIMDEARKARLSEALKDLRMVARCELKITAPGSAQTVPDDAPAADAGDYGGDDPVDFSNIR